MEFSEKGPMNPMNGHFSPINGLEYINEIQFSLCGTPTNLIFDHRVYCHIYNLIRTCIHVQALTRSHTYPVTQTHLIHFLTH